MLTSSQITPTAVSRSCAMLQITSSISSFNSPETPSNHGSLNLPNRRATKRVYGGRKNSSPLLTSLILRLVRRLRTVLPPSSTHKLCGGGASPSPFPTPVSCSDRTVLLESGHVSFLNMSLPRRNDLAEPGWGTYVPPSPSHTGLRP